MAKQPPGQEQRRAPRVWVSFPATVAWDGGEAQGVCTNISTCGIFVQTQEPLDIGADVRVEFELEGGGLESQVLVLGDVARRVPVEHPQADNLRHGHGIAFDRCMLGDDELREYIRAKLGLEAADVEPPERVNVPATSGGAIPGYDVSLPEPDHPALASIRRINATNDRPRIRWRWVAIAAPSVSLLAAEALLIVWWVSALRDSG